MKVRLPVDETEEVRFSLGTNVFLFKQNNFNGFRRNKDIMSTCCS